MVPMLDVSRIPDRWVEVATGAIILLAVVLTLRSCSRPDPRPVFVQTDTVSADAWKGRVAQLEADKAKLLGERDGLRGKVDDLMGQLRGRGERTARRVTVYDTVTTFEHDTLQLAWSIDRGQLHIIGALPVPGGHQPVELEGIDIRDCDDGVRTVGLRVICDRSRLGHLTLIGRGVLGAVPVSWMPEAALWRAEAGVRWTPAYRSTVAFEVVGTSDRRVELRGEVGVRVW